jgi:hypothetical protein
VTRLTDSNPSSRRPGQLTLFDEHPRLTDRQAYALDLTRAAGPEGLPADELGALLCEIRGRHPAGGRCEWDAQNGLHVLRALREKGLVRYRAKMKAWVATGDLPDPEESPAWVGEGPVPFGVIPF